jgi:glycosyltransferase involved in cell wall biosynthesis
MITRKIAYSLDFLPTYVFREIKELTSRNYRIGVFLPRQDMRSLLWIDIISSESDTHDISIDETLPHDALTCPVPHLMALFFKAFLPMIFKHPWRCIKNLQAALVKRLFRYFVIGLYLAGKTETETFLIHSHFAKSGAFAALWAAKLMQIPFTVTTHAVDIFVPDKENLTRFLFDEAAAILTISNFNREYISGRFGQDLKDKIHVTHLGLDPESLPDRICNDNPVPLIVCTASGLGQKKGVPVLLEACRKLHRKNMEFKCTIIGSDTDGTILERYRREIAETGLSEVIELRGLMQSVDVIEYLRRSDLFVLPSVVADNGDMDGIPVSLMESMGMGIPTVSTSISGIPELIQSGVNGYLVPPGDAEALADTLETLITDRELAERLGREGALKVRNDFIVSGYIDSLLSVWSGIDT